MSNLPPADFGLHMPFWIDTDGYSDRDREMFVCGAEFMVIIKMLEDGWAGSHTIHSENESRIRMAAAKLGRRVNIKPCGSKFPEWSEITAV